MPECAAEALEPRFEPRAALRELPEQADRHLGLLDAQALEGLGIELEEPRGAERGGALAADTAHEDAPLPEELAGSESRHEAARVPPARELHLPRLDHEERLAGHAFVEHDLAGLEAPLEAPPHARVGGLGPGGAAGSVVHASGFDRSGGPL
jgi:hypothetical protein